MIELRVLATVVAAWVTWLSWCISHRDFLSKEWSLWCVWNIFLFAILVEGIWFK